MSNQSIPDLASAMIEYRHAVERPVVVDKSVVMARESGRTAIETNYRFQALADTILEAITADREQDND